MLPIPGTGSMEHLEENAQAARVRLSPDDLCRTGGANERAVAILDELPPRPPRVEARSWLSVARSLAGVTGFVQHDVAAIFWPQRRTSTWMSPVTNQRGDVAATRTAARRRSPRGRLRRREGAGRRRSGRAFDAAPSRTASSASAARRGRGAPPRPGPLAVPSRTMASSSITRMVRPRSRSPITRGGSVAVLISSGFPVGTRSAKHDPWPVALLEFE